MAVLLTPTHPLQQVLHRGTKGNDVCTVSCIFMAVQKQIIYQDWLTHYSPNASQSVFVF